MTIRGRLTGPGFGAGIRYSMDLATLCMYEYEHSICCSNFFDLIPTRFRSGITPPPLHPSTPLPLSSTDPVGQRTSRRV